MKIYIEIDDTSQATGAYLSFNSRTKQGHILVKEIELPTEEEIIDQSFVWSPVDDESQRSFYMGAQWILSKLKTTKQ